VRVTLAKHDHALPKLFSQSRPAVFGLRVDYSSVLGVIPDRGLPPGVLIRELDPGSPAADKLKAFGDVAKSWLVTAVDGRPVHTPAAFEAAAAGKGSVRLTLHDPSAPEKEPEVTLP
jgi:S1-C subfamily serine protease